MAKVKAQRYAFCEGSLMGGAVSDDLPNGMTDAQYTGSEWLPVIAPSIAPIYHVFIGTEDEFFAQASPDEIVLED